MIAVWLFIKKTSFRAFSEKTGPKCDKSRSSDQRIDIWKPLAFLSALACSHLFSIKTPCWPVWFLQAFQIMSCEFSLESHVSFLTSARRDVGRRQTQTCGKTLNWSSPHSYRFNMEMKMLLTHSRAKGLYPICECKSQMKEKLHGWLWIIQEICFPSHHLNMQDQSTINFLMSQQAGY